MLSKRMQRIIAENKRFEKKSPYNFCDRWCERCPDETQKRCRLYQDEFERKITCIAYGREPDDLEVTKEILDKQYGDVERSIEKYIEEHNINIEEVDTSEIERVDKLTDEHSLQKTTMQYTMKAYEFLKHTFYEKKIKHAKLAQDFETISWYHTLLSVKMKRALSGLHEPDDEYEFGLCDAVAQFAICKKAISLSFEALQRVKPQYPNFQKQINALLALLGNISSRIQHIEDII